MFLSQQPTATIKYLTGVYPHRIQPLISSNVNEFTVLLTLIAIISGKKDLWHLIHQ